MVTAATLIQPTGEMRKRIREELNEDIDTRDQHLATIKDWLKKQPHLPSEWEDTCIMNFLRGCKFSSEKCKKKLDMYFTVRAACPEYFTNRDINRPELMYLVDKAQGSLMPGLTPQGRRVIVCRILDKTLGPAHLINAFKIAMMIGDVRLREEVEAVAGDVYILDASTVSSSHLAKLSLAVLKKFFICSQEAYPLKVKEIHVVNSNPTIIILINILMPFVKEKYKKRIFIHADIKDLQKFIPIDMLPVEYDGTGCSLEDVKMAWFKKLQDYTDWFKQQESIKADESLRPGKPTNYDELFGIEGSFRQLSID